MTRLSNWIWAQCHLKSRKKKAVFEWQRQYCHSKKADTLKLMKAQFMTPVGISAIVLLALTLNKLPKRQLLRWAVFIKRAL